MHHRVCNFNAGGKSIDEDATGFALENGNKTLRERNVPSAARWSSRRQLAVELVGGSIEEFIGVATLDEQSSGAEDFLRADAAMQENAARMC